MNGGFRLEGDRAPDRGDRLVLQPERGTGQALDGLARGVQGIREDVDRFEPDAAIAVLGDGDRHRDIPGLCIAGGHVQEDVVDTILHIGLRC